MTRSFKSAGACGAARWPAPDRPAGPWSGNAVGQRCGAGGEAGEVGRATGGATDRIGAGPTPDPGGRRGVRRRRDHGQRRGRDSRHPGGWCWPPGVFPTTCKRRKALFPPHTDRPGAPGLAPSGLFGATASRWGESAGGSLVTDLASPVAWAPVSRVRHADGSVGHFPHIIDRAKPGLIGVLANGQRFVNEADGYYDYTAAMVAAVPAGGGSGVVARLRPPVPAPLRPGLRQTFPPCRSRPTCAAAISSAAPPSKPSRPLAASIQRGWWTHRARLQRTRPAGRGPGLRAWLNALQPQTGRRPAWRPPTPAWRRSSTVLFYAVKVLPGQLRHLRRPEGERPCAGARARRPAHPRPVRGGHGHGQRHGRFLPLGRHQPWAGHDLRLHCRAACRRPVRWRAHRTRALNRVMRICLVREDVFAHG